MGLSPEFGTADQITSTSFSDEIGNINSAILPLDEGELIWVGTV